PPTESRLATLASASSADLTAHEILAQAAECGADYAAVESAASEVLDGTLTEYVEREAVESALDADASVASRDSVGGPAPGAVEVALDEMGSAIERDSQQLAERRDQLAAAENALEMEVDEFG